MPALTEVVALANAPTWPLTSMARTRNEYRAPLRPWKTSDVFVVRASHDRHGPPFVETWTS
jgi:hypothetical protein